MVALTLKNVEGCFHKHANHVPSNFLSQHFRTQLLTGKMQRQRSHIFTKPEHYMKFRKAILYKDKVFLERILEAKVPREAKLLGI